MFVHIYTYIHVDIPPKNGEIKFWSATNELIVHILVLVGGQSSFTVIPEYKFIHLLSASPY